MPHQSKWKTLIKILFCSVFFLQSSGSIAGNADVVDVKITALGNNKYRIDTSVKHADTGWDHYANAWDVLDEKGNKIGSRILHHPHVNEQPFTRSLTLIIPTHIKVITIRAKDSVHGYGGETISLKIP